MTDTIKNIIDLQMSNDLFMWKSGLEEKKFKNLLIIRASDVRS